MPDDHSKVVPLLPIPNRKVKRLSADDSADSRVKVGHRQASILEKPSVKTEGFFSSLCKFEAFLVAMASDFATLSPYVQTSRFQRRHFRFKHRSFRPRSLALASLNLTLTFPVKCCTTCRILTTMFEPLLLQRHLLGCLQK